MRVVQPLDFDAAAFGQAVSPRRIVDSTTARSIEEVGILCTDNVDFSAAVQICTMAIAASPQALVTMLCDLYSETYNLHYAARWRAYHLARYLLILAL
jgi:hypothetical protein